MEKTPLTPDQQCTLWHREQFKKNLKKKILLQQVIDFDEEYPPGVCIKEETKEDDPTTPWRYKDEIDPYEGMSTVLWGVVTVFIFIWLLLKLIIYIISILLDPSVEMMYYPLSPLFSLNMMMYYPIRSFS